VRTCATALDTTPASPSACAPATCSHHSQVSWWRLNSLRGRAARPAFFRGRSLFSSNIKTDNPPLQTPLVRTPNFCKNGLQRSPQHAVLPVA
jgi:hypothetical protein